MTIHTVIGLRIEMCIEYFVHVCEENVRNDKLTDKIINGPNALNVWTMRMHSMQIDHVQALRNK